MKTSSKNWKKSNDHGVEMVCMIQVIYKFYPEEEWAIRCNVYTYQCQRTYHLRVPLSTKEERFKEIMRDIHNYGIKAVLALQR